MQLNATIADYARNLSLDCDIDSTCVLITDKTTKATEVYYLGNFGVSNEVIDRYSRNGICDFDPYTDVLCQEHDAIDDTGNFRVANHPLIARCGRRAQSYWEFCAQHDVEVVGAATMRLQPRLYLTIGAHRDRRGGARGAVPVERLAFGIEVLQNKIATNLLSSLLGGGRGYHSLLSVVRPDAPVEPVPSAALLSARETEVARLVCAGKQNKEIAWIAGLSECTVENHLRRIYQKLGIHNRAALVARMNGVLN